MFFRQKQLPPHCEGLTPAQVKLVRKAIKAKYSFDVFRVTEKALKADWLQVLKAILRQPEMIRKDTQWMVVYAVINQKHAGALVAVADEISSLDEKSQASVLGAALNSEWGFAFDTVHPKVNNPQSRAAAALEVLVRNDDRNVQRIRPLLADNTNIHFEGGMLMKQALLHNRRDVVQDLIAANFDLALYGDEIEKFLIERNAPYDVRRYFNEEIRNFPAMPVVAVTPQDACYQLCDRDSMTRVQALPDGGRLTTMFNFSLRQQVVIAQMQGQVSAPAVTPFAQMDATALSAAVGHFTALGGDEHLGRRALLPAPGAISIGKN